MKKRILALTLSVLVAGSIATGCGGEKKPDPKPDGNTKKTEVQNEKKTSQAPAKKEKIRLYTDEQLKKMTPEERTKARQEEYRANLTPVARHAYDMMRREDVQKYNKISIDAYPHLKWGSTGYNYSGKLEKYGEVKCNFTRTLASDDRPQFKDDKGRDVKGSEEYRIEVLVGGCKGNCIIEAVGTHTKRTDAASYKKPVVETKTYVPFDKTYVRHEENGKTWVTHEKCGTK